MERPGGPTGTVKAGLSGAIKGAKQGGVAGAVKGIVQGGDRKKVAATVAVAITLAFFLLLGPISMLVTVGGIVGLSSGMEDGSYQAYNPNASAATSADVTGPDLVQLDTYEGAENETGTPWLVLAAVTYYETGPGAPYATVPGSCQNPQAPLGSATTVPASPAVAPYCPAGPGTTHPAATPTSPSATGPYVGPMQIDRSALAPAEAVNAAKLSWSAKWVGNRLHAALEKMASWDNQSLTTGETYSSDNRPSINYSDQGAVTVRADWLAAINQLPVANASNRTFDENVFGAAVSWALGNQLAASGGAGAGAVCTVPAKTSTSPPGSPQPESPTSIKIVDDNGNQITLDSVQINNAEQIIAANTAEGQSQQNTLISLMVALDESGLRNLSNPTVPGSDSPPPPAEPAQGVGVDHDSIGLFQQRAGWGSIVERMDPAQATSDFLGLGTYPRGLKQIEAENPGLVQPGLGDPVSDGTLAQLVQDSATPLRYISWFPGASALLAELGGATCSASGVATADLTAAQVTAVLQLLHAQIGVPYVWGGGDANGPTGSAVAPASQVGERGFDCSGLVLYVYAQAAKIILPHSSSEQWAIVQQKGHFVTNIAQENLLQPGDLVFFKGSDPPSPGHVGIYIGNDQMIDAPSTGHDVRVESVSQFGGFVGGGSL